MSGRQTDWLSPQAFARQIGASTQFVHRRITAGMIPYQHDSKTGHRIVHRCHIKKFRPYPRSMKIFSVEAVCNRTGLSKQTVCDLLKQGSVRYTCVDCDGQHVVKTVVLDAARPIKRWQVPEPTMQAFMECVRPNLEEWPTAMDIANRIRSSTAYVLSLYEAGRIRGQKSIIQQKVHIHPDDAARLECDAEHTFPIGYVSSLTGLAVQTIADIVRRGYFTQRYTNGLKGVVTRRYCISARKQLKRYWLSKDGVKALMQGVRPYLLHWPTATTIEQRYGLPGGTVSRYFNSGTLHGSTSIKGQGQRLHIHPSELRSFAMQKHYNIVAVAEKLGTTPRTLRKWNHECPQPFLRAGLGHSACVPPHIVGKMLLVNAHFTLSSRTIHMICGSLADVQHAIQKKRLNALYYDGDRPPSIRECKNGMRLIFPDQKIGIIRATKPNPYRPSIEVFRPDDQRNYLYAVAK